MRIYSLEGNIGAGKSTVLRKLKDRGYRIFTEDLGDWGGLLKLFYDDPVRWSFLLQTRIMLSMKQQMLEAEKCGDEICFFERSPQASLCFSRNSFESGYLTYKEFETILIMHERLQFKPVQHIYIRTPVSICIDRIAARGRQSEKTIEQSYLEKLEAIWDQKFGFSYRIDGMLVPQEITERIVRSIKADNDNDVHLH